MTLELVRGTDAKFAECGEPYRQEVLQAAHDLWLQRDDEDRPAIWISPPEYYWDCPPERLLFIRDGCCCQMLCFFTANPLYLSDLDPTSHEALTRLTGLATPSTLRGKLTIEHRISIQPRGSSARRNRRNGTMAFGHTEPLFCELLLESSWRSWASNVLVLDQPLPVCYSWARRFETALDQLVPKTRWLNRIGICRTCNRELALEEITFRCEACWVEARRQAVLQSEERRLLHRRSHQRQLANSIYLGPEKPIPIDRRLGRALHKAYDGRCQYCAFPVRTRIEELVIEHVIPRSMPLDEVCGKLQEYHGITESLAQEFCATHLPPIHDCLLNLTLACLRHNSEKSNRLLHPAALQFLLMQSRRKARSVLKAYAGNTGSS